MMNLEGSNHRYIKKNDSVQIMKGRVEHLKKYEYDYENYPKEFRMHLHDEIANFFVAMKGEDILHITWCYSSGYHNRLLSMHNGEVEIKRAYTLPGFRGRGLAPRTLFFIINYLKDHGIKRIFISVQGDNLPSIRAIEKTGFVIVKKIRFMKILGIACSKPFETSGVT